MLLLRRGQPVQGGHLLLLGHPQAGLHTDNPKSSVKFWTLRLQAKEGEHGFKLTDKEQQEEMEVEYQAESRYFMLVRVQY